MFIDWPLIKHIHVLPATLFSLPEILLSELKGISMSHPTVACRIGICFWWNAGWVKGLSCLEEKGFPSIFSMFPLWKQRKFVYGMKLEVNSISYSLAN